MAKNTKNHETTLNAAYKEALNKFGQRPYVTAIDIGPKYTAGKATEVMAVRIHVSEKRDKSVLEAVDIFPELIQGVPVDIIQGNYSIHVQNTQKSTFEVSDRTMRQATLQPGISVANKNVSAGTLGLLVRDNRNNRTAILSNWHVLAGSKQAMPGDEITQPGPYDGGQVASDTVALLERMMLDKDGDAAIAVLNQARKYSTAIIDTGAVIKGIADPKLGDVLCKSGRTTGVTSGKVEGTGTYFIDYPIGRVGVEGFILVPLDKENPDNIEISMGGDSGSIWYDEKTGIAAGLHFAGEINPLPNEEHAIACFASRVFQRLDISLPSEGEMIELETGTAKAVSAIAGEIGNAIATAIFDHLDGREIRRFADALSKSYPRLAESAEVNSILGDANAPEIGPFGAVAIGFAAGAAARIIGKSTESVEVSAAEGFPIVVAAFLAGAAAGARAVDGKL